MPNNKETFIERLNREIDALINLCKSRPLIALVIIAMLIILGVYFTVDKITKFTGQPASVDSLDNNKNINNIRQSETKPNSLNDTPTTDLSGSSITDKQRDNMQNSYRPRQDQGER